MKNSSYFKMTSNKLFWLKECIMHPEIGHCMDMALKAEISSRDALLKVQSDKLKRIIEHAIKTVPYYREWIKTSGKNVADVQISDFPIITKKDVKGRERQFVSDGWDGRLNWTRTSGSTGEPFRFARSEYDYTYATLWRGLLRFGIRPGDKRVLVKGVDETASVSVLTKIKRAIYGWINRCIVVDAHFLARSDINVAKELKRILAYRPD